MNKPYTVKTTADHWPYINTRKKPDVSFVYFVQGENGGLIKIGTAEDPIGRVYNMQSGSPVILRILGCIEGDHVIERAIHRQFPEERRYFEWFEPSRRLLAYIEEILQSKGVPREIYENTKCYRPQRAQRVVNGR